MSPSLGRFGRWGERVPLALVVAALLLTRAVPSLATPTTEKSGTVEQIVATTLAELPPPPLFVGVAQVIVPPGARTTTAGTAGPRLLAIEAGSVTVGVAGPADVWRAAGPGTGPASGPSPVVPGDEVALGPGDRLTVGAGAVQEVRNDGTHAAVLLDAALFPPGAEPVAAAFTSPDGVSFQLLAGAVIEAVPAAPARFSLKRLRLERGQAMPAGARTGPVVAYVEAGSLDVVPTAGEVRFGRAAARAPSTSAGPLRAVPVGRTAPLTAGATVALATGAAVVGANERDVPTVLLLLEIVPV